MLDPQGYVAECTGENLFLVTGGKIITPALAPVLDGITRRSVLDLASDAGLSVTEAPVSRDQLYTADEVFVCGTASEVIGLREIDFRVIGTGKTGQVTRELQKMFSDAVHGRHPRSAAWLDWVGRREHEALRKTGTDE